MQKTWFKEWFNSSYYHLLYFKRDHKEAAIFIDNLINYLKPSTGSRMLDVACGKGRHSIQLANKGFDVTGIDLSDYSINSALQHASETLHFYKHDMRLPFCINYFDYAFNFFTSFGYFKTRREHDNTIRTIAQAIKKEGVFVMDFLNVHYAEDHLVHQLQKEIEGINFIITKWFDETHFYKKIIIEDEAYPEPLEFIERVAKFSLGDFTEMFAYQGLQIQEVFGDYDFGIYDVKKSQRMVMIAKKVNA
ncbi:MAG TPA: methyltransferase domain-containing protein [Ferruginibacter sp.]|nr:methyltransferase domain-containing protein [Ferruginibacter sp.]